MKYIDVQTTDPFINLALEQYVFDELSKVEDFFLLWQNDNAIIIGRNQNTYMEINQEYVKQNHIKVARRLSGGGAVYHDLGNLNYTFIVSESREHFDFSEFCRPVITALKKFGVNAEINGRNDMLIDGKKFSGNAQYFKNKRTMHHGTLMYDSNIEVISNALQVSKEKIESKGVKSVRSHVTNIRPYMKNNIRMKEFKELLVQTMLTEKYMEPYDLTDNDIKRVQEIAEDRYATWEWNYGKSPEYAICKRRRFEGCGQIELYMDIKNGCITGFDIFGDYFSYKDKEVLCKAIIGSKLIAGEIGERLRNINTNDYIHNFTNPMLIDFILQSDNNVS